MKITNQDIRNYIEGNANHLLAEIGLLPQEIKIKVEQRQLICNACLFLNKEKMRCDVCKCKYPGFSYSLGKTCPKNYWDKIK